MKAYRWKLSQKNDIYIFWSAMESFHFWGVGPWGRPHFTGSGGHLPMGNRRFFPQMTMAMSSCKLHWARVSSFLVRFARNFACEFMGPWLIVAHRDPGGAPRAWGSHLPPGVNFFRPRAVKWAVFGHLCGNGVEIRLFCPRNRIFHARFT